MKRSKYVLLIVLSIILLDQVTKYLVISYLNPFDAIEVFPFLHLVSVRNTGAAFGMFKGLGNISFITISVFAIMFVLWFLIRDMYNYFGLYGQVVDFIDFSIGKFHWPAFNVADSSLTIGIIIIFSQALLKK
jgi:signal peptidase II